MHLTIIIPVYNEGAVVKRVIDGLPKKIKGINKITVLAVNDGSMDGSAEQIKKTKAKLISHVVNLGYGVALTTGLEGAKMIGADIAVTFDGDGQHDPSDIEKIIQPILRHQADIVIGTRLKKSEGMPSIKKIGNLGLNIITYALSRMWTSDSQSGFKAFSKKALNTIQFDTVGYESCSQIIIEAAKNRLKISEIPIKVIYNKYSNKKGQSIFNGVNIVVKLIFRKITG